jgi:hypothetical protein
MAKDDIDQYRPYWICPFIWGHDESSRRVIWKANEGTESGHTNRSRGELYGTLGRYRIRCTASQVTKEDAGAGTSTQTDCLEERERHRNERARRP